MRARGAHLAGRYPALAGFSLFVLLAAVSRPASFQKPIERDTGQLLYVGDLVAHGATPYVDAAFNKGPMAFLTFAVIDTVTFTKVVLVRLVLVVFAAAAALAVAVVVDRRAGRSAALVAGVSLALLAASAPIQGDDPNTEQFGIAFLAGAWALATLPGGRAALGSGVLLAAGVAFNPLFAIVAPAIAWELLADPAGARPRRLIAAVAGGVALFAALAIWLGLGGALDDMWDQIAGPGTPIRDSLGAGHATGAPTGVAGTLKDWLDVPGGALYLLGAIGAAVALLRRELRIPAVAALLWIVLVWVRVELQSYAFPHHFYIALPAIAVGIALGVASLTAPDTGRRIGLAAIVLAMPFVAYVAGPQIRQLEVPASERWALETPDEWSTAYPVAQFIDQHTRPSDRIFATGSDPEIYWLSRRRAMTRYFDWFIPLRDRDAARERVRDLEEHPPAAIAIMSNADAKIDAGSIRGYMDRHAYVIALQVDGSQVWLPRGGG